MLDHAPDDFGQLPFLYIESKPRPHPFHRVSAQLIPAPRIIQQQRELVGQINGVAVYTPLAHRTVEIGLQTPSGFSLSNGELHVTYLKPGKDEHTGLLAESRLTIP